jgi:flagellar export protein FliJ
MSFQFPLSPVLWMRGVVEEREERTLTSIVNEISAATERLNSLSAEIARADAARRVELKKVCDAAHLHAWYAHFEELRQQRQQLELHLKKLEELRERQLLAYQAARRDREMLDGIREQELALYETVVARREQSTLDDTFGAQRSRKACSR